MGEEVESSGVGVRLVPRDNVECVIAGVSLMLDNSMSLWVRCAGRFPEAGGWPPCNRCPAGPCGHLHTTGMMSCALLSMSYFRHRMS